MFRNFISLSILLVLSLFVVPYASAHTGEPRLEINVERISPGGIVELRGVDFEFEESVTLSLISANTEIPLNEVTADTEGIFTQPILLPADLPLGEYNFRAQTDHEVVMSPLLTVWGTAVEDQESNILEDQSDVQFEAMPTQNPAVATTVPPPAVSRNDSAPQQNAISPWLWMAVGIAIMTLFGVLLRRNLKL